MRTSGKVALNILKMHLHGSKLDSLLDFLCLPLPRAPCVICCVESIDASNLSHTHISTHTRFNIQSFNLVRISLDASSHLYKRVCPSVRRSVQRSVRRSVRPSVHPSVRPSVGRSHKSQISGKWAEF